MFLGGGYLDFQLYENEQPSGDLEIIPFDSKVITILFNVKKLGDDKKCQLNDVEQLSHHKKANLEWNSVKHLLEKFHFFELDDDDIERIYTWLPLSYEGWMNLTLTVSWFSRITDCIVPKRRLVNHCVQHWSEPY